MEKYCLKRLKRLKQAQKFKRLTGNGNILPNLTSFGRVDSFLKIIPIICLCYVTPPRVEQVRAPDHTS